MQINLVQPWGDPGIPEVIELMDGGHRYNVITGGRSSGKSWTLVDVILHIGFTRTHRIISMRKTADSLSRSAHQLFLDRAEALPHLQWQKGPNNTLVNSFSGSTIGFHGANMSSGTAQAFKSAEGISILFVEEGADMSHMAWKMVNPTIRKPGARIFIAMNPYNRDDVLYQLAHSGREEVYHLHKTWEDNTKLDAAVRAEAEYEREHSPDYAWQWLGQTIDTVSSANKILPYLTLQACKQHVEGTGPVHAGFDIADSGDDCAVAVRQGPALMHVERWNGKTSNIGESIRKAFSICVEHGVERLYFDGGGMAAGMVRGESAPCEARPVHFGGLFSPQALYRGRANQRQTFANAGAQMGWHLKLRGDATARGDDPDKCLYVWPSVPPDALIEFTRPEYERGEGKIKVNKNPDGQGSPDMFDAVRLAFCAGVENGLTFGPTPMEIFRKKEGLVD